MSGFRLGADEVVGLAMVGAALRMSDDDGLGTRVLEHLGCDVAGMGAGGERMAVLGAERDLGSAQDVVGKAEGRRRADHDIGSRHGIAFQPIEQRPDLGQGGCFPVHLPIAGHQRPDCLHLAPLVLATYDAAAWPVIA